MKNFALMAAALAAVLFAVGCQNGGEAGTTPDSGSHSSTIDGAGLESKPAGEAGSEGKQAANDSKAADSSGIMYAASFDEAVASAEKDNKYVLIKFTADWCSPCHAMSDDMKKTDLSAEMGNVIPVEVDIDKETEGAAMKNHFKDPNQPIPYLVLIDKSGKEVAKQTGQMEMADFKTWLKEHAKG